MEIWNFFLSPVKKDDSPAIAAPNRNERSTTSNSTINYSIAQLIGDVMGFCRTCVRFSVITTGLIEHIKWSRWAFTVIEFIILYTSSAMQVWWFLDFKSLLFFSSWIRRESRALRCFCSSLSAQSTQLFKPSFLMPNVYFTDYRLDDTRAIMEKSFWLKWKLWPDTLRCIGWRRMPCFLVAG